MHCVLAPSHDGYDTGVSSVLTTVVWWASGVLCGLQPSPVLTASSDVPLSVCTLSWRVPQELSHLLVRIRMRQ